MEEKKKILICSCKNELYTLNSKKIKTFCNRLRSQFGFPVDSYDFPQISYESIKDCLCFIIIGAQHPFSKKELEDLRKYVETGGSLFLQIPETSRSNLNYLIHAWGIEHRKDSVIRTVFFKYFHPKEVCIENGVVNRSINIWAGKSIPGSVITPSYSPLSKKKTELRKEKTSKKGDFSISDDLVFAYPYGCSLNVKSPAFPILSSGHVAYPVNRPICGVYEHHSEGKVVVLGSAEMFTDKWIDEQENGVLQHVLFRWILDKGKEREKKNERIDPYGRKNVKGLNGMKRKEENLKPKKLEFSTIDSKQPDISDYHYLPSSQMLAEKIKPCLQENTELPKDFSTLFDDRTFSFRTDVIPEVIECYKKLKVKKKKLSLIPPAFETPLPPLTPAVYHPILNDP